MRLINSLGEPIKDDPWREVDKASGSADYVVMPIEEWEDISAEQTKKILSNRANLGIRFPADLQAQELISRIGGEEYLTKFSLLQADIPGLKDGRCFSLAQRIRSQYKYKNDLRAAGSYLTDQIFFLSRCGFSSFLIDTDLDDNELRQVLQPFSEVYQQSIDQRENIIDKEFNS